MWQTVRPWVSIGKLSSNGGFCTSMFVFLSVNIAVSIAGECLHRGETLPQFTQAGNAKIQILVFLDTPSLSLTSIPSISQYIPVECKADVDGHEVWQNASHAQSSNQKPGATPLQKKHHCINFRPEWCDRKKVLALGRGYLAVTIYIYICTYIYICIYIIYIIYIHNK